MKFTLEDTKPKEPKPIASKLKAKRPMGRQRGAQLKPLDMEQFITEHDCMQLYLDHPFILDIKLYENTLMRNTLARTNYNKQTIEIASKVLNNTIDIQREVFIRAISNFLAIKLFNQHGKGEAFGLLVERYTNKRSLKYVEPKTGQPTTISQEQIRVKH